MTTTSTKLKVEESTGSYPIYSARWHFDDVALPTEIIAIEWITATFNMQAKGQRTRIALIDTPVAEDHINLKDDALDTKLRFDHGVGASKADSPAAPPSSSHGTSMAGLMVGRPNAAAMFVSEPFNLTDEGQVKTVGGARPLPFPFSGVDPTATVVPFSVSAEPTPRQMLGAIERIEDLARSEDLKKRIDLVVIASDLSVPGQTDFPSHDYPEDWKETLTVLDKKIKALSKIVPIICAAGNSPIRPDREDKAAKKSAAEEKSAYGKRQIAYPARLASPDNGIFSVTAHNAIGQRSSYAPESSIISFSAPSSDAERTDRELIRLDPYRTTFGEDEENFFLNNSEVECLPPHAIIATDVPGQYGHNSSDFDKPKYGPPNSEGVKPETLRYADTFEDDVLSCILEKRSHVGVYYDFSSHYCLFGGTSAATAIVGGMFALAMSTGKFKRGDSGKLKAALTDPMCPIQYSIFSDFKNNKKEA
ncbi:MAG: S8/S53 family peptidase [Roseobacter sp.]